MPSATLVLADYPVGHASGFGETLYNLFQGFPDELLFHAHPEHLQIASGKELGQTIALSSPLRPTWLPSRLAQVYYPILKIRQWLATQRALKQLIQVVKTHSIKHLLIIPVSPWILTTALLLQRQIPGLKLVLFVMDDWQGHHQSHGLPYTKRRQQLLGNIVRRASVRFAVSREMATHYADITGKQWQVVHNGVQLNCKKIPMHRGEKPRCIVLAGDVNVFRSDAVIAFAQALERYAQCGHNAVELHVLGNVAADCLAPLASLKVVKLLGRINHSQSLQVIRKADLLYLPLGFDERCVRISGYSLPTKLPEYLASGKLILFHAPRGSAVYKFAERHDLAPRLASTEAIDLDAFIESWVGHDFDSLNNLQKYQHALSAEFNLNQLCKRFQEAFA